MNSPLGSNQSRVSAQQYVLRGGERRVAYTTGGALTAPPCQLGGQASFH